MGLWVHPSNKLIEMGTETKVVPLLDLIGVLVFVSYLLDVSGCYGQIGVRPPLISPTNWRTSTEEKMGSVGEPKRWNQSKQAAVSWSTPIIILAGRAADPIQTAPNTFTHSTTVK